MLFIRFQHLPNERIYRVEVDIKFKLSKDGDDKLAFQLFDELKKVSEMGYYAHASGIWSSGFLGVSVAKLVFLVGLGTYDHQAWSPTTSA